jgi:protein TonB
MGPHSDVSPLGRLLEELRATRISSSAPRTARPFVGVEPELRLEAGVVSGAASARPGRPWRWATSLVIHGAFVVAVVAVPLLLPDELPSPVAGARVFFVQSIAPPPPPPPPAVRPAAVTTAPRPSASASRPAAPAVTVARSEVKPEDVLEPAAPALPSAPIDEGVPGGVEEGVPGAIVGGIIEKASATEPVAPALRVGGAIKEPRKLKNVTPVYPDVAARGLVEGVVILEIAIEPNGHVDDVRVLRSIPLLDAAAVAAARQWVFAPTLYRGVPVSVTMTVSVRFSLTQGASAS